jgi:hypothetical protein
MHNVFAHSNKRHKKDLKIYLPTQKVQKLDWEWAVVNIFLHTSLLLCLGHTRMPAILYNLHLSVWFHLSIVPIRAYSNLL